MYHVYIRSVFGGKTLLDTQKDGVRCEIERKDECWVFRMLPVERQTAEHLLLHRDELNIFSVPLDHPNQKSWYYSRNGKVEYDEMQMLLTIHADVKMDYTV